MGFIAEAAIYTGIFAYLHSKWPRFTAVLVFITLVSCLAILLMLLSPLSNGGFTWAVSSVFSLDRWASDFIVNAALVGLVLLAFLLSAIICELSVVAGFFWMVALLVVAFLLPGPRPDLY